MSSIYPRPLSQKKLITYNHKLFEYLQIDTSNNKIERENKNREIAIFESHAGHEDTIKKKIKLFFHECIQNAIYYFAMPNKN